MNGPKHYTEAERLLGVAARWYYGDHSGSVEAHTAATAMATAALAHAKLAAIALDVDATIAAETFPSDGEWAKVTS